MSLHYNPHLEAVETQQGKRPIGPGCSDLPGPCAHPTVWEGRREHVF
jgi:hypothetical protein